MPPPLPPAPNFLIIGAAKAATTSLASLLDLHPEAAIARPKECHFFSLDQQYRLGWDAYLSLYKHCRDERAIGDASTSYSRIRYHPHVLAHIRQHIPAAKIIYMVRHPIERMESAYAEHMKTPENPFAFSSINDAILRQPMIVDSSRYWEVFDAYRRVFGEARIKVVWFEEYVSRTKEVFKDVCRFLEIDDTLDPDLQSQKINGREDPARLIPQLDQAWDPALRRRVIEVIQADNLRFLAHFDRPRDHWGDLFQA